MLLDKPQQIETPLILLVSLDLSQCPARGGAEDHPWALSVLHLIPQITKGHWAAEAIKQQCLHSLKTDCCREVLEKNPFCFAKSFWCIDLTSNIDYPLNTPAKTLSPAPKNHKMITEIKHQTSYVPGSSFLTHYYFFHLCLFL